MGAGWSPPPIEPEHGRLWRYLALPYRRYDIDTHLTVAQCEQALKAIVEPRKWFRRKAEIRTDRFQGEVTGSKFFISRIFRGRNSFVPMISGVLRERPGGTTVSMTMRLHWIVLGFWGLWMTGVFVGAAATLFASNDCFSGELVPLVIMLAFGYLMCSIIFEMETAKARQLLTASLMGRHSPAGH
jgi:hypothetical protein